MRKTKPRPFSGSFNQNQTIGEFTLTNQRPSTATTSIRRKFGIRALSVSSAGSIKQRKDRSTSLRKYRIKTAFISKKEKNPNSRRLSQHTTGYSSDFELSDENFIDMFHMHDALNQKSPKLFKTEKPLKKKTKNKNNAEKRLQKFMENITNRRTMEFKFGNSKALFKKI